jgi:hypothetical protein
MKFLDQIYSKSASGALGIKGEVDPVSAHAMETAGADLSKAVSGSLKPKVEQIMDTMLTVEQLRALKAKKQIEENRQ